MQQVEMLGHQEQVLLEVQVIVVPQLQRQPEARVVQVARVALHMLVV